MRKTPLFIVLVSLVLLPLLTELHGKTLSGRVLRTSNEMTIYVAVPPLEHQVILASLECPDHLTKYFRAAWEKIAFDLIFRTVSVEFERINPDGSITGQVYFRQRWMNRELLDVAQVLYQQENPNQAKATQSASLVSTSTSLASTMTSSSLSTSQTSVTKQSSTPTPETRKKTYKYPKPSLKGVRNIFVSVEEFNVDLTKIGLTPSDIQMKTELQLKNRGLQLVPSCVEHSGNLVINLTSISRDVSSKYISVEVRFLDAKDGIGQEQTSLWQLGSLIFMANEHDTAKIYESINRKVELFIKDYIASNPGAAQS